MTDSSDDSDVKKQIRAVLQCNKDPLTAEQLRRYFQELEGRDIPFRKLGYNSLADFLCNIPDFVECWQGRDGVTYFRAVTDATTQHIANMVAAQRSNRNRGKPASKYRHFSHYGRSVRPSRPSRLHVPRVNDAAPRRHLGLPARPGTRPKGFLPSAILERMVELARCYPYGLRLDSLHAAYLRRFSSPLYHTEYGYDTLEEFAAALEQRGTVRLERRNSMVFLCSTNAATPSLELNKNSALRLTTPPASSEPTNRTHFVTHQRVELQAQAPPPSWPVPQNAIPKEPAGDHTGMVSEMMKEEFRKVLCQHPDGLDLSRFPREYRRIHQKELDIRQLGYISISDMVTVLTDVFIVVAMKNSSADWKLYDATNPEVSKISCDDKGKSWVRLQAGAGDSRAGERKARALRPMNKMHGLGKIPSDAAPKTARYEYQQFTEEHNLTEFVAVYISQVESPGQFWMQIRGLNTSVALEKLMDDLEKLYCGPRSSDYVIPEDYYMIGCPCAALFPRDNNWHRGLVLGIPTADRAEILYIDYGTHHIVLKSQLRLMTIEFLTRLPAQAIKTKLALLRPPDKIWSDRAKQRLLQLVEYKQLMAFVCDPMSEADRSVILCDVSGENDVYIHKVLLDEKLAVMDEEAASGHDKEIPKVEQPVHNTHIPEPCSKPLPDSGMGFAPSPLMQLLGAAFTGGCSPGSVPNYPVNNNALFGLLLMHALTLNNVQLNTLMGLQSSVVPQMAPGLAAGADGTVARGLHGREYPPAHDTSRSFVPFNVPVVRSEKRQEASQSFSCQIELSDHHPTGEQASTLNDVIESEDTDDDEFIRQVCEEIDGGHKKYVKSVCLGPDIVFHVINYLDKPYVSAGDVSAIISPSFDVRNMLHLRDQVVPSICLKREDDDALFNQLEKYGVKGIKQCNGGKDYIWLYELERVPKILSTFLRRLPEMLSEIIQDELNQFTEGTYWREEPAPTTGGIDLSVEKAKNWIEQLTLEELTEKIHAQKCERQRILEKMMKDIDDLGAVSYVDKLKEIETHTRQMSEKMKELQQTWHKIKP